MYIELHVKLYIASFVKAVHSDVLVYKPLTLSVIADVQALKVMQVTFIDTRPLMFYTWLNM